DAELAFKTGFADKTISSVDIAKALNEYQTMRNRSAVIAGTADPTRTAQGYFSVSGHAPYHAGETATTNLLTGTTQTTPLGEAKIGTEKAHAGAYAGQEASSRAAAGEHGARTRQIESETRSGVRMGAPVVVDDPELGLIYTSPGAAIGRTPAAKPGTGTFKPVLQRDGTVTYERIEGGEQVPQKAPVVRAPRHIGNTDRALITSGIKDVLKTLNVDP